MDWMISYEDLDDDQKEFVDTKVFEPGNIWIKGYAGSGKSVLLIHALRTIRRREPNATMAIVVYTHSLVDLFRSGLTHLQITNIPVMTYHSFRRSNQDYDYIFCDEVQDVPEDVLTEMKNRSRHLHVAGDANQSIYNNRVDSTQIVKIIGAQPFELKKIYRLTKSIIKAVQSLLPNMDIFSAKVDVTKQDVNLKVKKEITETTEVEYIWKNALESANRGYSTVVLCSTRKSILKFANTVLEISNKSIWQEQKDQYDKPHFGLLNRHLSAADIKLEYVGNGYGSLVSAADNNKVILMTYHSSKGLDFESVFVPYLSSNNYISRNSPATLLMVAITRSRMNLTVSYCDYPHPLLNRFIGDAHIIQEDNNKNIEPNDDFDV